MKDRRQLVSSICTLQTNTRKFPVLGQLETVPSQHRLLNGIRHNAIMFQIMQIRESSLRSK